MERKARDLPPVQVAQEARLLNRERHDAGSDQDHRPTGGESLAPATGRTEPVCRETGGDCEMKPFQDLTGQKFGRLTVTCYAGKSNNKMFLFSCICDCGKS